jgi:hypothetical protein
VAGVTKDADHPVGGLQVWSADLPAQHRHLMAQHLVLRVNNP